MCVCESIKNYREKLLCTKARDDVIYCRIAVCSSVGSLRVQHSGTGGSIKVSPLAVL